VIWETDLLATTTPRRLPALQLAGSSAAQQGP
jgi:hypothetical protein